MTVVDLVREHNMHISDGVSYLALSDICVETFGRQLPLVLWSPHTGEWPAAFNWLPDFLDSSWAELWRMLWAVSIATTDRSYPVYSTYTSTRDWHSSYASSSSTSIIDNWRASSTSRGSFFLKETNMIFNVGDDVLLDDGRWFWSGRIIEINPVFTNQVVLSHVAKIFNLGSEAEFVTGVMPRSVEAYPDHVKKVVTYVSGNLLSEINHTLFRETRRS